MEINVTVTKKIEQTVQLTPPLFWKEERCNEWVALLDEKTVCKLYINHDGSYVNISHGTPQSMSDKLNEAYRNYNPIDERTFFHEYEMALDAIRLSPKMEIDTGRDEAVAMYQRENAI